MFGDFRKPSTTFLEKWCWVKDKLTPLEVEQIKHKEHHLCITRLRALSTTFKFQPPLTGLINFVL